ncbi:hypothetical protein [Massilia yuzhufengensis]|uniref:hypothetical protein n=1 Tax=Massilia yuzhufengensis TaxID=1164594 RepID=UPI001160700F|nr:hypothetical protein [Massilia yuzhufengensis]
MLTAVNYSTLPGRAAPALPRFPQETSGDAGYLDRARQFPGLVVHRLGRRRSCQARAAATPTWSSVYVNNMDGRRLWVSVSADF